MEFTNLGGVKVDLVRLKKKLDSYRTQKGRITRIPDELAYQILLAWEEWSGPASGFYKALGADFRKMASVIGRAKKLKREGAFADEQFKEIKVEGSSSKAGSVPCNDAIIVKWGNGKIIRFRQVDQLVDFLNKAS